MIRERITKSGVKYEGRVKFGKRVCSKRFTSPKEANRWVTETRYKRDKKVSLAVQVSINDMWEAYQETAIVKGIAPSTLVTHKCNYGTYLEPFFRNMDMTALPIEDHERFMGWVYGHDIEIETGNRVRALASVLFSTAIRKRKFGGAFTANPYNFIEKRKGNRPQIEYWNTEEANTFLEANKDTKYYPLWVTFLNLGLRAGELVALDREQIDTHSDIIAIDRAYCKKSKAIKSPKGKITRHLGLSKRNTLKNILYPLLPEKGFIFRNSKSEMIHPDILLKDVLPKACERAGVKNIGLKGFRHTFASNFVMAGGSIWDLSKELGHTTVTITNDYYAHFSRQHIQDRSGVVEFGPGNVIRAKFSNAGD